MSRIISAVIALLFFFSLSALAETKEVNIISLGTGEYVLIDSLQTERLPVCVVDFVPRLYLGQMVDGISDAKRPLIVFGKRIEFISSHQSIGLTDSLSPFNPGKIILAELSYSPELKIWRRFKDIPLSVKTVAWGQRVSILSPVESLKPGVRYALFYGNSLHPLGTVIPLDFNLRAGVYYFMLSDSTGQ